MFNLLNGVRMERKPAKTCQGPLQGLKTKVYDTQ
jgi:hypothetical protein